MRKFFCCLFVVLILTVFGSCSSDNIRKFGHSLNGLSKWNLSGYSAKAQQQFNSSVDEFISSSSDFSLEGDKEDIKQSLDDLVDNMLDYIECNSDLDSIREVFHKATDIKKPEGYDDFADSVINAANEHNESLKEFSGALADALSEIADYIGNAKENLTQGDIIVYYMVKTLFNDVLDKSSGGELADWFKKSYEEIKNSGEITETTDRFFRYIKAVSVIYNVDLSLSKILSGYIK